MPVDPAHTVPPIPPPAPNVPFGVLSATGEVMLTPAAFEFLQELWAAIQGHGGVIDIIGGGGGGGGGGTGGSGGGGGSSSGGASIATVQALINSHGADQINLTPPPNNGAILDAIEDMVLLVRPPPPQLPFRGTPVLNEVPAGLVNGTNVTFTLAHRPTPAGIWLFLNGLLQQPTTDYTLAGATITMVSAPPTTTIVMASYNF